MNTATLRPHRGDLVLNLSILSLFLFPLGIFAWILGGRDLAQMRMGAMDPAGRGTIHCARFIGVASALIGFCVFAVLALATVLVVFGVHAIR